ncbi:MAG: right-handed parallel beta-helix repeat-containing protein, partial [Planctomycetales bacterium]|nr:right-handed parallel beta-helix repeat-containing protein [Planctomycetales bacterium]
RVGPGDEADYRSVQDAVRAAAPGAIIEIGEGTYHENIVIEKSVTLRGSGIDKTIIQLPGDVGPTIEAYWDRIIQQLESMTLEELKSANAYFKDRPSSNPFIVRGTHDVHVEGMQFVWGGPRSTNPAAINCIADIAEADVVLRDVAIIGSPDDGIHLRAGAQCEMNGCVVAGNWGRGVVIGQKDEPTRKVHLVGCDLRNNQRSHIVVFYDAEEVLIERNLLHGSAWFGMRPGGKRCVIRENAIFDNARSGHYSVGTACEVRGNLFFANGFGGISCWNGNRDTIVGNTFVGNGNEQGYGISCISDARPTIRDNIFVRHQFAIQSTYSGADRRMTAVIGEPQIGRNLCWQNKVNVVKIEPIRDRDEGSIETAVALDVDLVVEWNPRFKDSGARDFSLEEDSPARQEKLGVADVMSLASRFPLHERERAILPDGDQWDFSYWKEPPRPDARSVEQRLIALYERKQLEAARNDVGYVEAFRDLHAKLGRDYPNFELKGIDWQAVGAELLPRSEAVVNDREFGLLCSELVARLQDSHAAIVKGLIEPPAIDFPQWDPGFACLLDDREEPVIYYVDRGGPADSAGLKVGMTVVSINGRPANELIDETMAQIGRYVGYSSDRYLRYQAVQWFVRQMEQDARTRVTVKQVDGTEITFDVPATLGVRYLPRRPVPTEGINDSANVDWTMLRDDIGLIFVRRIRGDLMEQLDRAVMELKDAKALIIDVRGNSGGGFDSERSHVNFTQDRTIEPARPRFSGPMALLIDSRCISAGEGWASWFIAHNRARTFGTATAGASARKTTYEIKNKLYKVVFPVKAYQGYLDRVIESRGLEPDVQVRQNAHDLAQGKDTVAETAVLWLQSL